MKKVKIVFYLIILGISIFNIFLGKILNEVVRELKPVSKEVKQIVILQDNLSQTVKTFSSFPEKTKKVVSSLFEVNLKLTKMKETIKKVEEKNQKMLYEEREIDKMEKEVAKTIPDLLKVADKLIVLGGEMEGIVKEMNVSSKVSLKKEKKLMRNIRRRYRLMKKIPDKGFSLF
jgi:cysteinyl-tRNA synthetase